jgi:hypothetical protein
MYTADKPLQSRFDTRRVSPLTIFHIYRCKPGVDRRCVILHSALEDGWALLQEGVYSLFVVLFTVLADKTHVVAGIDLLRQLSLHP